MRRVCMGFRVAYRPKHCCSSGTRLDERTYVEDNLVDEEFPLQRGRVVTGRIADWVPQESGSNSTGTPIQVRDQLGNVLTYAGWRRS